MLPVVLDLIPAAVKADDVGVLAFSQLIQDLRGGGGAAAQVDQICIDLSVAQLYVFPLFHGEVVAVHITLPQVVNDLVPVALGLQDDHIIVAVSSGEDFSICARSFPQAEGRGIYNANGGFHRIRSIGGQGQGADQGGHRQNQTQKSLFTVHTLPSVLQCVLFCQSALQPDTANIQRRVQAFFFALLYNPFPGP